MILCAEIICWGLISARKFDSLALSNVLCLRRRCDYDLESTPAKVGV